MMNFKIKQQDATDCGPACLSSISSFYGLGLPLGRIRQLTGTNASGTTLSGLMTAAKKLGFEAKAVKASQKSLLKVPKPAIAHLQIKDALLHYVVLLTCTEQKVELMDPGSGKLVQKKMEEFLRDWTGVMLLLVPGKDFKPGNHKISKIHRFKEILKPHLSKAIAALVLSVVFTLLGFTIPLLIQTLTDRIIPGSDLYMLLYSCLLATALVFAQMGLNFYKDLLITRMGVEIDRHLIGRYYTQLMRLPQSFFDYMKAGEILSRIGDAVKIRNLLSHTAVNLLVNGLILTFSVLILFSSFWKLGLLVLSLFPFYLLIYAFSDRLNKITERRVMERSASFESQMVETVSNIRTIKIFGIQNFAMKKTQIVLKKLLDAAFDSSRNHLSAQNASRLLSSLFAVLLLCYGSLLVIRQAISLGELLSFYAITAYFTGPIIELILANKSIQNALIAADRIFDILDLETVDDKGKLETELRGDVDIEIRGLGFAYENGKKILKELNATFLRSEITAITGASGSGKSTLLCLVQGLYKLNSGSIRLGGRKLSEYSKKHLHRSIALVPQKIEVFSGNLLENVALGHEEPDPKKVQSLIRLVGLENRFGSDEKALTTRLGENGSSLSGGEKRKLGLARALYLDPKVLLLDEVTSSLDRSSEMEIIALIKLLSKNGMTVVLTSHKWSTVSKADRAMVLQNGKIAESGSPALLASSGKELRALCGLQNNSPAIYPKSHTKTLLHEQPQTD